MGKETSRSVDWLILVLSLSSASSLSQAQVTDPIPPPIAVPEPHPLSSTIESDERLWCEEPPHLTSLAMKPLRLDSKERKPFMTALDRDDELTNNIVTVTMEGHLGASLASEPQAHALDAATPPQARQASRPLGAASPTPRYILPDIPAKWLTLDTRWFSLKATVALLYDYTFFGQDAASEAQVGRQEDTDDLRAGRLLFSGQLKFPRPWSYTIAGDYNEFRRPEDRIFEGLDAFLSIPLWGDTKVTIGKQKEPFVYEMVGDAANIPQQERVLSPFFVSRNVGIKITGTARNDRMTWSAGWFNDWFTKGQSFDESGNDFALRVTGLPLLSEDGARYLHLAAAARYAGDEGGKLRLKGRPESNVADRYVDTGEFTGDSVRALGFELLWSDGPFSITTEWVPAWVDAPQVGSPRFFGLSVVGSWVLTGEHRPYDRKVGYARRIIPRTSLGAWEVVARYSYIDLADKALDGGELSKWYFGLNWWVTRQWKFGVGFGLADLNRLGVDGRTTLTLLRSQWLF